MENENFKDSLNPNGIFIQRSNSVEKASDNDINLIKGYESLQDKGEIFDGRRITIVTSKLKYKINEEIKVIHIVEYTERGHEVFIMGPKKVYGEYIDDSLCGSAISENISDPFRPVEDYDGRVLQSPAIDCNYYITSYIFNKKGIHSIYWKLGKWKSNTLNILIE